MKYESCLVWSLVSVFGLGSVALGQGPDIKEIMGKVNKAGGLYPSIQKGMKTATPNWGALKNESEEFGALVLALGKNKPPKGDAASWQKLTKDYADEVAKLKAAVGLMNKGTADAAIAKLGASCSACHKAHKN